MVRLDPMQVFSNLVDLIGKNAVILSQMPLRNSRKRDRMNWMQASGILRSKLGQGPSLKIPIADSYQGSASPSLEVKPLLDSFLMGAQGQQWGA